MPKTATAKRRYGQRSPSLYTRPLMIDTNVLAHGKKFTSSYHRANSKSLK